MDYVPTFSSVLLKTNKKISKFHSRLRLFKRTHSRLGWRWDVAICDEFSRKLLENPFNLSFFLLLDVKLFNPHFFTFSSLLFSFKVSWMRKRDLHILTSNNFLYTGDQRFSVIQPQDTDEWNLKIEYAQPKDAGTYECQVCNYFWFIQSPFSPLFLHRSLLSHRWWISNFKRPNRTTFAKPAATACRKYIYIYGEFIETFSTFFLLFLSLRMLPPGQHRAENQLCRKFGCRK